MADNVTNYPYRSRRLAAGYSVEPPRATQDDNDAGRYRLTIEKEPDGFVYKTLDRVTGEVIRQLPREECSQMRDSPAYDVRGAHRHQG